MKFLRILEAKDQQLKELKNELASLNQNQPRLHYVAEFAGNQFFNMQTTQTHNFSSIVIFARVAYRLDIPEGDDTRNFGGVLVSGATNFDFNDYNIELKKYYNISGQDDIHVAIDSRGTGLDFTPGIQGRGFISGEIFIKFKLTKKQQIDA